MPGLVQSAVLAAGTVAAAAAGQIAPSEVAPPRLGPDTPDALPRPDFGDNGSRLGVAELLPPKADLPAPASADTDFAHARRQASSTFNEFVLLQHYNGVSESGTSATMAVHLNDVSYGDNGNFAYAGYTNSKTGEEGLSSSPYDFGIVGMQTATGEFSWGYRYHGDTGEEGSIWQYSGNGVQYIDDNTVATLSSGSSGATLLFVNKDDGVQDALEVPGASQALRSLSNGNLVATGGGSNSLYVYVINPQTRGSVAQAELDLEFEMPSGISASLPLVINEDQILASSFYEIISLHVNADGTLTKEWSKSFLDEDGDPELISDISIHEGTAVITTSKGSVNQLDASTGELSSQYRMVVPLEYTGLPYNQTPGILGNTVVVSEGVPRLRTVGQLQEYGNTAIFGFGAEFNLADGSAAIAGSYGSSAYSWLSAIQSRDGRTVAVGDMSPDLRSVMVQVGEDTPLTEAQGCRFFDEHELLRSNEDPVTPTNTSSQVANNENVVTAKDHTIVLVALHQRSPDVECGNAEVATSTTTSGPPNPTTTGTQAGSSSTGTTSKVQLSAGGRPEPHVLLRTATKAVSRAFNAVKSVFS